MQLTPDARRASADARRNSPSLTAMVVQSAAQRVALNFVLRAAESMGKIEKEAKCFGNEADAIAWLDEKAGTP